MWISAAINENELPERFRQVFEIAPQDLWQRRHAALAARERQNPFLSAYFDERYTLERFLPRAVTHWSENRRFPAVRGPDSGPYFQLYSFVHVLASVYPLLSEKGQSRVRGYLRDGLRSHDGLAAFAHELAVAVHLWSAAFDVEFTDIEGRTRFDILARKDGLHLEVDCKTASGDVGRQIHRRRVLELFNRLHPALEILLKPDVGCTVDIVLPGALHGAEPYMNAVTSVVSDAAVQNRSASVADVAEVSLGEFDPHDEPTLFTGAPTAQSVERIAERLGRINKHLICLGSPHDRAAVVAIVSSRKDDRVADGIYRALKQSAEGQFGGTNPALLAINLLEVTTGQLRELASGPSALRVISNRLFEGERRKHLFGVAFVSPASIPSERMGMAGAEFFSPGMAVMFRREGHPLSQDPRLVLFQHHDRPTGPALWDRLPFWIARVGVQQVAEPTKT
jgi:hypothetical protein